MLQGRYVMLPSQNVFGNMYIRLLIVMKNKSMSEADSFAEFKIEPNKSFIPKEL